MLLFSINTRQNKSDGKAKNHDFSHMWDIKQKAINEQMKPTNPQVHTTVWLLPEGKGVGEVEEGKGGIDGDGRRLDSGW